MMSCLSATSERRPPRPPPPAMRGAPPPRPTLWRPQLAWTRVLAPDCTFEKALSRRGWLGFAFWAVFGLAFCAALGLAFCGVLGLAFWAGFWLALPPPLLSRACGRSRSPAPGR